MALQAYGLTFQVTAGDTLSNICHYDSLFQSLNISVIATHSPVYDTHIRFLLQQHSISNSYGLIFAPVTMFQRISNWLHYQNHLGSFLNYTCPETRWWKDQGLFFWFCFLKFNGCGTIFSTMDFI